MRQTAVQNAVKGFSAEPAPNAAAARRARLLVFGALVCAILLASFSLISARPLVPVAEQPSQSFLALDRARAVL